MANQRLRGAGFREASATMAWAEGHCALNIFRSHKHIMARLPQIFSARGEQKDRSLVCVNPNRRPESTPRFPFTAYTRLPLSLSSLSSSPSERVGCGFGAERLIVVTSFGRKIRWSRTRSRLTERLTQRLTKRLRRHLPRGLASPETQYVPSPLGSPPAVVSPSPRGGVPSLAGRRHGLFHGLLPAPTTTGK
jgi:hypothetical protein